jgi:PPM family protein phosphatase
MTSESVPPTEDKPLEGVAENVVETPAESAPPSDPLADAPLLDVALETPVESGESPPMLGAPSPLPALPEAPAAEPPRPLLIGAFLRLEFEIKDVLVRGFTNLYRADGGDYGAATAHLIAERESEAGPEITFSSALFPPREAFSQEGRDYLLFEWDETTPLLDYRAPSHDEGYLRFVGALAEGMAELEAQNCTADFSRELLRVAPDGELKFYGFAAVANESAAPFLEQLASLNSFLLKRVFAEAVTMRLGDEFGALVMSDEVKNLARKLGEGEFDSVAQVAQAVRDLLGEVPRIECALLTDVGQERELNEDAGAIFRIQRAAHLGAYDFDVFVVSDGMGGHEGGEVASDLTLSALQNALTQRAAQGLNFHDNVAVRAALLDAIDEVNRAVVNLTETPAYRAKRAKPGATLVFALRVGQRVFVGNVGDSRAYRWNEAEGLTRISKDHSYVQSLIDQGELSEEEAWDHPEGSIITAHIGDPKLRLKDVFLRLFRVGDKLLLVSDGVVDMLRDAEIAVFLKENDPREVVRDLVDASNTAGGADNITALCVVFS